MKGHKEVIEVLNEVLAGEPLRVRIEYALPRRTGAPHVAGAHGVLVLAFGADGALHAESHTLMDGRTGAARVRLEDDPAQTLLSHLSLLFVPAGVGIIQYGALLREEWLALAIALVVSTLVTVAVTALAMRAFIRQRAGNRRRG